MFLNRPRRELFPLISAALGSALLLPGCGDSRESGTQVQVSEEVKAQIQARRDTYKSNNLRESQRPAKSRKATNR